jgi:hypothetical protein
MSDTETYANAFDRGFVYADTRGIPLAKRDTLTHILRDAIANAYADGYRDAQRDTELRTARGMRSPDSTDDRHGR